MLKYVAVFLTAFRAVAAFALPVYVLQEQWHWAALLLLLAAYSDPMDGWVASRAFRPDQHWTRRHGKLMNDVASGILSWTAPGSILVWLWLNHFGTSWFWSWVGICAVFIIGTIVFMVHKSDYRYEFKHVLRAEVLQGWFFALLLFVCGIQLAWLVGGLSGLGWTAWIVSWAIAGLCSAHRWTDRPELRIKYLAALIVGK